MDYCPNCNCPNCDCPECAEAQEEEYWRNYKPADSRDATVVIDGRKRKVWAQNPNAVSAWRSAPLRKDGMPDMRRKEYKNFVYWVRNGS